MKGFLIVLLVSPVILSCSSTSTSESDACHMISTYSETNNGCFDDVDRDGEFKYERGDRQFSDVCEWRLYQLKAVARDFPFSTVCD